MAIVQNSSTRVAGVAILPFGILKLRRIKPTEPNGIADRTIMEPRIPIMQTRINSPLRSRGATETVFRKLGGNTTWMHLATHQRRHCFRKRSMIGS